MSLKQSLVRTALSGLFLILSTCIFAQTKTVTGTVLDKDNIGIAGASVTVKGSTSGTNTSSTGAFSLNVPSSAKTLVISYVGYASQEVPIGSGTVSVTLAPSTGSDLNEVVVVGYGTIRKKDVTGSVAQVQAKDFNSGQINSPQQLLQGKVAGLQITNSSGQPGGITIVKIRGNNSIRSGNNPLYVVDGVPLDGRSARPDFNASGVGQTPGGDPLTFIDPTNIASIDVLKDASASAIYGSRGANGVVLLTTKKGISGPAKLEAGASYGISDIMRRVDVLDAAGYRGAISKFNAANTDSGGNYDPFGAILRTSRTLNYNVALSGGSENGKYRASFFASNQDGVILKTNLKKYVANFNGSYKFLDNKLSLDFFATASNFAEHIAPISQDAGSAGNLISLAMIWNPTLSYYNADGTYNQANKSGQVNPLALSAAYNDITNVTTLLANINAAYKFTPWLEYRLLIGANSGLGERKGEIQGFIQATGGNADNKGVAAVLNNVLLSNIMTHTLTFNKAIAKDLTLNALVGYEYYRSTYRTSFTSVYQFDYNLDQTKLVPIHYYDNLQDGKQSNLISGAGKDPNTEIQSYFGRVNFNLRDKYYLTATLRSDGSSRFGADNKYAYFPSVAAGWTISNEDFMKDNRVFNTLKLRAGYGETGNQEFGADAAVDRSTYVSYGSLQLQHVGNPTLRWETVKSVDIGLDFSILNGRVFGTVDYFNKETSNPLFLTVIPQPSPSGTIFYNLNGAKITNKGVELSLGADIIQTKNVVWSVNGNIAFVKNRFDFKSSAGAFPIAFSGGLHGQGTSGAYSQAISDGQPIDVFYVPRFLGFDKDGIGTYGASPEYVGDPNPKAFYGFTTSLNYHKFLLTLGFNGQYGNKIYNNTAMSVLNIANINGGRNIAASLVNAGESPANAITPSSRFVESGSFLKMNNASLRYAFGNVGKVLHDVSLYVSANNLFVITKYKGFDPEVNVDKALNGIPSLGVDYIGYPTQRTFLFGVNFGL